MDSPMKVADATFSTKPWTMLWTADLLVTIGRSTEDTEVVPPTEGLCFPLSEVHMTMAKLSARAFSSLKPKDLVTSLVVKESNGEEILVSLMARSMGWIL